MTDLHPNSKSDTVLLLDAALADIYVDHGPERTSVADQTTYIDESPSARSALTAPRNITVKLNMQSGWSGTILELGDGVNHSYRISLSASEVSCSEVGLLRVRVAVPGLSGVDSIVLINWSQRVENSSIIDEVTIGNLDANEWAFGRASHAASAVDATDTLTIAARSGGASAYSGGINAILGVHLGRRYHAAPEAWEDWGTTSTAPAFDGRDRNPILTSPSDELTITGDGNLAGPSLLIAGAATRQAANRGVGSLLNLSLRSPAVETVTSSPTRFFQAAPDGGGWQWCVRYLWHGYLSPKVNVAQVRLHVHAYDFGAGTDISPIRFRTYSVADLPLGGKPSEITYYRGPIVSVTAVDTDGVWLDLGTVTLARASSNLSYVVLGFWIDPAPDEGILFVTAWELNAITVEPYSKDLSEGGLGGDLDLVTP